MFGWLRRAHSRASSRNMVTNWRSPARCASAIILRSMRYAVFSVGLLSACATSPTQRPDEPLIAEQESGAAEPREPQAAGESAVPDAPPPSREPWTIGRAEYERVLADT